jgi:hypothetical protein
MIPSEAASSVAPSAVASQGCATATRNRGRAFAVASSRSYFSRLRVSTGARCDAFEDATMPSSGLPETISALGHSALRKLRRDLSSCRFSAKHTAEVCDVPARPDEGRDDLTAPTVHKHLSRSILPERSSVSLIEWDNLSRLRARLAEC